MRRIALLCLRAAMPAAALAAAPALAAAADAETEVETVEQLRGLSIEELAQVEVTSASRRAEPLSEAPTAIYVITEDQIARTTATSLPQLLREAPNLQVQRIDARQYAISARGFNGYETANKLLARIDGRTIYTPLLSGIFWELHNPLLDDLQQIEVVSGPGGTLFGPNAVNGVINIASKSALDTLGGLARGTLAANELTAALRYGMPLGDGAAVRVYGNYFDRAGLPAGAAGAIDDGAAGVQGGFRVDFGGGDDAFTLQGDIFDTDSRLIAGDGERGHNLLARWTRRLGPESTVHVQAYYDDYRREFVQITDALETFDIEAQVSGAAGAHRFVAGVGVRTTNDLFDNDLNPFVLVPESKRLWMFNGFVQDEIALSPSLRLIAGVKLERSSFSGVEVLPNLRAAWQPSDRALLWASVSRAVRTPSRIDRQLTFLPILAPSLDFKSEKLTAIEAGYRGTPLPGTSLSVSLFYNLYDDLRSTELTAGALPFMLANGIEARSWGVEAWATQQLAPWWRLRLGLATLGKDVREKPGVVDIAMGESTGNDPDYTFTARSQIELSPDIDVDIGVRAVDDLERPAVAGFVEADARIGWRLNDTVELFVAGTDLLHRRHDESGEPERAQLVERSVRAGTRIRF